MNWVIYSKDENFSLKTIEAYDGDIKYEIIIKKDDYLIFDSLSPINGKRFLIPTENGIFRLEDDFFFQISEFRVIFGKVVEEEVV